LVGCLPVGRRVFTRNEYKDLVVDCLEFCQKNNGMEIHAWCIMTSHIHLIFRSLESQKPELLLGDFKRFTSRNIIKAIQENSKESQREYLLDFFRKEAQKSSNTTKNQFWRHDNKPIELWSIGGQNSSGNSHARKVWKRHF
jgi:REP element-mobilizing transposase RayT